MNITDERIKQQEFGKLSNGDVFEYDLIEYIKTDTVTNSNHEANFSNAVSVYCGIHEYFEADTYVQPLDAELIIRG